MARMNADQTKASYSQETAEQQRDFLTTEDSEAVLEICNPERGTRNPEPKFCPPAALCDLCVKIRFLGGVLITNGR
jgi:hypothetical protein